MPDTPDNGWQIWAMTAPIIRWPAQLDAIEAEHEHDGAMPALTPPFAPGERIVEREAPQHGSAIVDRCEYAAGGIWMAHTHGVGVCHRVRMIGVASNYVLCPAGWTEPPPLPMPAVTLLENSTDGAISAAEYADAHRIDAEQFHEWAEAYLALAEWWTQIGALVAPGMAAREAPGFRRMAGNAGGNG